MNAEARHAADRRRLLLLLHAGFLLTGAVTVVLGPLIPEMKAAWGVGTSRAASLFLVQFVVSSAGSALAGLHLRRSLWIGYGAMTAGLLLLASPLVAPSLAWPLARPAIALLGLGMGLTIPATNLTVALLHPARRGAALATLNLLWGLGAMACPLLFAVLRGHAPPAVAPALLAVPATLVSAVLLGRPHLTALVQGGGPRNGTGAAAPSSATPETSGAGLLPLLLLAGLLFLDVGIENAVGGWLVELADRVGGERTAVSMVIGSGFWGAVLAGRAAAPALLARLREATLYRAALLLALAGTGGLLLADSRPALAAAALVTGLALAPVFPLTVALLAEHTARTGSARTGWVFAFGGLGGAVLPWATGRLTAGVPAAAGLPGAVANPGIAVPVAAVVGMGVLFALYRLCVDRS